MCSGKVLSCVRSSLTTEFDAIHGQSALMLVYRLGCQSKKWTGDDRESFILNKSSFHMILFENCHGVISVFSNPHQETCVLVVSLGKRFCLLHKLITVFGFSGQVWLWERGCIDYCLMLLKPNINLVFLSLGSTLGSIALPEASKPVEEKKVTRHDNWSKSEHVVIFNRYYLESYVSSECQTVKFTALRPFS